MIGAGIAQLLGIQTRNEWIDSLREVDGTGKTNGFEDDLDVFRKFYFYDITNREEVSLLVHDQSSDDRLMGL